MPRDVPPRVTWSTTVRFAEVDAQGVVFNAHYLTWCDEAMNRLFATVGKAGEFGEFSARVRLVSTAVTWRASARWRDEVDVDARVVRIGTTSVVVGFTVRVGESVCCKAQTVYVHVGDDGRPAPVPEAVRAVLTATA